MARPTKEQQAKKDTKSALLKALKENGLTEKYYTDQVEEYMKYYENLEELNKSLADQIIVDVLKEKRQVTKEMRSILMFLGLKPPEGGGAGYEEL